MNGIKVSIVIINFNYSRYISRAICSALGQFYPKDNFEIIIIDDGSTDKSEDIIKSFGKLVVTHYNKQNKGLSYSRKKGIEKSNGDYIMFLDSDDFLSNNCILFLSKFLDENPELLAVSSDYSIVSDDGETKTRTSGHDYPIEGGIMIRKPILENLILSHSDIILKGVEDIVLQFRLKHPIYYLKLSLYRYRYHNNSMTFKDESKQKTNRNNC